MDPADVFNFLGKLYLRFHSILLIFSFDIKFLPDAPLLPCLNTFVDYSFFGHIISSKELNDVLLCELSNMLFEFRLVPALVELKFDGKRSNSSESKDNFLGEKLAY